jgi:hypothetical protein
VRKMALDPFADPFASPTEQALGGDRPMRLAGDIPTGPGATHTLGIIRPETGPGALPSAMPESGAAHGLLAGGLGAPHMTPTGPGIGQRLPSARPLPPAGAREVNIAAMAATPQTRAQIKAGVKPYLERALDLFKNYTTVPVQWSALDPYQFRDALVTQIKNNLLTLYDHPSIAPWRDRAAQWYDGGRDLIVAKAKQYNLSNEASAGVYAALSPQKDWRENIVLGDRVLATVMDPQIRATQLTPEMQTTFARLTAPDPKTGKARNAELARVYPMIAGKSYDQVSALAMDADERAIYQAAWVRLYDQTYRPQTFQNITPEGQVLGDVMTAKGTPAGLRWQTLEMTANAIRMIESNGRDAETVLGEKHKVRNFYNNLLNPNDPSSVTIDTHAVAAALLQPLGSDDLPVTHNFSNPIRAHHPPGSNLAPSSDITGMRGTYGIYAEAYRQAAAERGILPRQMQSITWEASRGLFTNKSDKQKDVINNIWQRYRRGQISLEEARQLVLNAAGGIDAPEWFVPAAQGHAPAGYPANQGELPGAELHGPGPAAALSGGGGLSAPAVPQTDVLSTPAQSALQGGF